MKDRILSVFSVLDDRGVAIAQIVLRADGILENYGDPSAATEALALLLRVGPHSCLFDEIRGVDAAAINSQPSTLNSK